MDIKTEIKTEADESMCDESEMNSLKELGADIAMEETDIKTEIKTEVIIDPSKINCLQALGPYIATKDNSESFQYFSDIPKLCFEKPCILGVDEAGRGPVLGPMVYGIAYCVKEDDEILKTLGCADSKQLTEEKRDLIFDKICTEEYATNSLGWAVDIISPNDISNSMLRRAKRSLNEVSMDSAIGLIKRARDMGVNIAEVYVDTVGPPEKYQDKLSKIFPDYKITVAKKADSTYPIVSAASICAKVSRDHSLKVWQFPEGLTLTQSAFGSGYPGDPVTKAFLQENIDPVFGFPRLVRFSWATAEKVIQSKALPMKFEDDSLPVKSRPISNYFSGDKPPVRPRHIFFRDRCLDNPLDI